MNVRKAARLMNALCNLLEAETNEIVRQATTAGWKSGEFRIIPKDGGFSLQEHQIMLNGKPEWKQVYWSRNKAETEKALARRKS